MIRSTDKRPKNEAMMIHSRFRVANNNGLTTVWITPSYGRLGLVLIGGSLLAVDAILWRDALALGFHLGPPGGDFVMYRDAAAQWLATGEWFRPYQLEGPYAILSDPLPILYPPSTIPFFLAFEVIPAQLYWLIPIVGTAAIVVSHRPPWQAWMVIAGCLLWPPTTNILWLGNPTLWIVFVVALATRWPAFGPWVLLKPTMAPFAFIGVTRRSWYVSAAVLVGYTLLWTPLLYSYVIAVFNADSPRGVLYSWTHWPPVLIPIVAWLAERRHDHDAVSTRTASSSG